MNNSLIKLGTRYIYGKENAVFGVTPRQLFQHAWFIGQSGTGKSTMAHNVAVQLIEQGYGVCIVDPHGSLAEGVAAEISKRRTNDVVWFDPAGKHSVGLNLLSPVPPSERSRVTAEVERMFEHLFDKGWGHQSAMLLRNCVATMLDCPVEFNPSLLSLYRLLMDEKYRDLARKFVTNTSVQSFWNTYLDVWDDKKRADASAPLINKLDALIHSLDMKCVLGQVKPKFDPLTAMDEQQVVLCNLSAGRLGEENTEILGSSLVTAFKIAGFRRAKAIDEFRGEFPDAYAAFIDTGYRDEDIIEAFQLVKPFFLILDEFQIFLAPKTLKQIFSQSRKYGLHLLVFHQYSQQISDEVKHAVKGNVGTRVSFRVGPDDVPFVAKSFGLTEDAIAGLSNYEVAVRFGGGTAFRGKAIPPLMVNPRSRRDVVIRESARRFAKRRWVLEAKHGIFPEENLP